MISGSDLDNWADTNQREAQDTLPETIRRLINALSTGLLKVDMPAGDGVTRPGWDGMVDSKVANVWVPKNLSVWEMGTGKDITAKANLDYENRIANSAGVDKKKATFVFVTLRRWAKKREWEALKRKCGDWADVRAYDADDLEQWLSFAPAVNVWLSELLCKREPGFIAIEDWWRAFSSSTTPKVTPELLTAGRQSATTSLLNWFHQSEPASLRVKGETVDEALAFISAVLVSLPSAEQKHYLSRIVLVQKNTDIALALNVKAQHIYLLAGADGVALGRILGSGHRALIPVGRDTKTEQGDIVILRQSREAFENALITMGFDARNADRLRRETGRSLTVLRRRVAVEKSFENPEWIKSSLVSVAKATLLAGAWDENKPEDKKVLEILAGRDYSAFSADLISLFNMPNTPIRKEGGVWKLVSPTDAWGLLTRFLTEDDLARYEKAVLSVFSITDPRLDVAPNKRYAAGIYGKTPPYSEWLRSGLAENLVLLAIGDDQDLNLGYLCQDKVNAIVRHLLKDASAERWYSISRELPMLAEAAPEEFLRALQESIHSEAKTVMLLFQEEGDWGGCNHSGLLWGLEGIAWDATLLPVAADSLASLAELDPGGRYCNRPLNSLREVFLPWMRYTNATDSERLGTIKTLIKNHPEIGWKLLTLVLPDSTHSTSSPTHKPIGRVWALDVKANVTEPERHEFMMHLYEEAFQILNDIPQRYCTILSRYHILPVEQRPTFLNLLKQYIEKVNDPSVREIIRNELRGFLHNCRRFSDSGWDLPKSELDVFGVILRSLDPSDPVLRFAWLFESAWPELEDGEVEDSKTQEKKIILEREFAINKVYSLAGVEGITRLATNIKDGQYIVGFISGKVLSDEKLEEYILNQAIKAGDGKIMNFVSGFVTQSIKAKGETWITACLTTGAGRNWTEDCFVAFCLCLPHSMNTWLRVEHLGEGIKKRYWEKINFIRCENDAELPYALEQLLAVDKPLNAINSLRISDAHKFSANLLIRLLNDVGQSPDLAQGPGLLAGLYYEIEEVLRALDSMALSDAERDQLVLLEFQFLQVFRAGGKGPNEIIRRLKNNPHFFVQVASWGFKSDKPEVTAKEESEIPADKRDGMAKQSWDLLRLLKSLPGTLKEGQIDAAALRQWVLDARDRFDIVGRKEVGDILIGNVLANSPLDPDGAWPLRAIRDLIEEIKSAEIESGIKTQSYNNRGIVSRAIGEGGSQERSLKTSYTTYASKMLPLWPRTGRMLQDLAASYERDAHRVDIEARQDELRWD